MSRDACINECKRNICRLQVDFVEFVFDLCRKMKHSHEKMQPVCKCSRSIANCLTCELEQVNRLEHGSKNSWVSRNMFFDSFGKFGRVTLVCMSRRF